MKTIITAVCSSVDHSHCAQSVFFIIQQHSSCWPSLNNRTSHIFFLLNCRSVVCRKPHKGNVRSLLRSAPISLKVLLSFYLALKLLGFAWARDYFFLLSCLSICLGVTVTDKEKYLKKNKNLLPKLTFYVSHFECFSVDGREIFLRMKKSTFFSCLVKRKNK